MFVDHLMVYPLKSGSRVFQDKVSVLPTGFMYDRFIALINERNQIITAREDVKLLDIESEIFLDKIDVAVFGNRITYEFKYIDEEVEVFLFGKPMSAFGLNVALDN